MSEAAALRLPTLSSFFIPADELRRRQQTYHAEVARGAGEPLAAALLAQSWGMRCVHVGANRDDAIAATEQPFMAYQERLAARANVRSHLSHARLQPFSAYLESGRAIFGGADEVVDGLGRYGTMTGYDRVLLLMSLAGMPASLAIRSMELFAARVMPQLAAWTPPAVTAAGG